MLQILRRPVLSCFGMHLSGILTALTEREKFYCSFVLLPLLFVSSKGSDSVPESFAWKRHIFENFRVGLGGWVNKTQSGVATVWAKRVLRAGLNKRLCEPIHLDTLGSFLFVSFHRRTISEHGSNRYKTRTVQQNKAAKISRRSAKCSQNTGQIHTETGKNRPAENL